MRKLFVLAVVVGLFVASLAGPASADEPTEFIESATITDLNPCDAPNTHEISFVFNVKVHEHGDNLVFVVKTDTSTDDGFSGVGRETTVVNSNNAVTTFNFVQSNPETGQKFTVKGHLTIDLETGEAKVDNFVFRCIKG